MLFQFMQGLTTLIVWMICIVFERLNDSTDVIGRSLPSVIPQLCADEHENGV